MLFTDSTDYTDYITARRMRALRRSCCSVNPWRARHPWTLMREKGSMTNPHRRVVSAAMTLGDAKSGFWNTVRNSRSVRQPPAPIREFEPETPARRGGTVRYASQGGWRTGSAGTQVGGLHIV